MSVDRLLEPFARHPDRAVVIVDFDGTLAPIVDDPASASPLPAAERALARLAGHIGRVAVVSGRPVAFLQSVLAVDGLTLVGQYGLEQVEDGRIVTDPAALASAGAVEAAAVQAEAELPALRVERKGVAVTLHWRTSPDLESEAVALGRRLAQTHGLATQPGRLALELRSPVKCDKGTVTRRLVEGGHAAMVVGDDYGDIAMFSAVDELVAARRLAHAVRVAISSSETPPALVERADHTVEGPAELAALFDELAGVTGRAKGRYWI